MNNEQQKLAKAWYEGAQWAAVELGAIKHEKAQWATDSDNPYLTPAPDNVGPRGCLRAQGPYGKGYYWVAQVLQGDVVLWEDNSTNWKTLRRELDETLAAYQHLHWLGYTGFKSWDQVVDEADEL
jgi:hypothetical protein